MFRELLVLSQVTQLESKSAFSKSGLPGTDNPGQRKALRECTSSVPFLLGPELQDPEDPQEKNLKPCTKEIWLFPPLLDL